MAKSKYRRMVESMELKEEYYDKLGGEFTAEREAYTDDNFDDPNEEWELDSDTSMYADGVTLTIQMTPQGPEYTYTDDDDNAIIISEFLQPHEALKRLDNHEPPSSGFDERAHFATEL